MQCQCKVFNFQTCLIWNFLENYFLFFQAGLGFFVFSKTLYLVGGFENIVFGLRWVGGEDEVEVQRGTFVIIKL